MALPGSATSCVLRATASGSVCVPLTIWDLAGGLGSAVPGVEGAARRGGPTKAGVRGRGAGPWEKEVCYVGKNCRACW